MGSSGKSILSLSQSHCLYLDEIIDVKFINGDKEAVVCSNSETLKLLDVVTGQFEVYSGHTDIVISLDKFTRVDADGITRGYVVSGAKDSQLILWRYDGGAARYHKLKPMVVFKGHT